MALKYPISHHINQVTNTCNEANSSNGMKFSSVEDIFTNEATGVRPRVGKKVSCREYYCYKLQGRPCDRTILLMSGRLLQQFIMTLLYIKVESTRLDFLCHQQYTITADLYQGIVDSILGGESGGEMVGKRVLPASFVGGPLDMHRRYLDAIALVTRFGKPNLFITMTCNPEWKEITNLLKDGHTSRDRSDLTSKVFWRKILDLKFSKKNIWGSHCTCIRHRIPKAGLASCTFAFHIEIRV